jgi:hypothetical protein
MFRNDRDIEVTVHKNRIVIVRKNYVFEKGEAVSSEKNVCRHQEPPQRPIKLNAFKKHYNVNCSLVSKWHRRRSEMGQFTE